MDTFSIIQGIHFSWCSDAGKTYYIINTLYNAINIWCHKSASCLLELRASSVWVLQSNRTSVIRLQPGKGSVHLFSFTSWKHQRRSRLSFRFTVHDCILGGLLPDVASWNSDDQWGFVFLSCPFHLSRSSASLNAIKPSLYIAVLMQDPLPPCSYRA